jgi:uncharacterized linocin/CFP29 family protein
MNDLRRPQAPFAKQGWDVIDDEVRSVVQQVLAARKVVDFVGPLGWETSALGTGRCTALSAEPSEGVEARLREARPLVELRAPFRLRRSEIDAVARGAKDPDLNPATDAARKIALAEDRAVFHGYKAASIDGICEAAAHKSVQLSGDYENYPGVVARALDSLRNDGVGGPYAIALGHRCYTGLTQTTVGGFPVMAHVLRLIERPAIWAPALEGAVVMSLRGGDFELTVGRDLSVGYWSHTPDEVELYIEESLAFQIITPEAAVPLLYEKTQRRKRRRT